jgi:hypothetical protein
MSGTLPLLTVHELGILTTVLSGPTSRRMLDNQIVNALLDPTFTEPLRAATIGKLLEVGYLRDEIDIIYITEEGKRALRETAKALGRFFAVLTTVGIV